MFGFKKKVKPFDYSKFSDATIPEKFKNGCIRKPEVDPNNWEFSSLPVCKNTAEKALPKKKSIKDGFGPVYCQPYGNCTSNAVLGCDAYYYHPPTTTWEPSTVFTYYTQLKYIEKQKPLQDVGSCIEWALKAVKKYGACNAKVWPNTKPFNKKPSKAAFENGLKGKEVTSYYRVKSLLQIKKALNSGYPVAVCIEWAFKYYDNETFILNDPTKKEIKDCPSCHAVVIVGYDDTKELFEIRNSWSEQWGNKGYAYITYKTMKNIIFYEDSYAIVR